MRTSHHIGDESRQQMIAETSRFIEWGLRHPDQVVRIPAKPEDQTGWPASIGRYFWTSVLAPRDLRNAGVRIFQSLASKLRRG